ncbi:MAG: type I methionyl aminopeptidase [Anaerolineae bacterium]
MAIHYKNEREIAALREAGRLVALTFQELEAAIKPGAVLRDLDDLATEFIERSGAKPLYKGYQGSPPSHPPFPGTICSSVNAEICHGIPDGRALREGDIVGIDIGLRLNGFCGDACITFPVGRVSSEARRLLDVTRECLDLGIAAAQPGRQLGAIGAAIQAHAEGNGFNVVRVWGGHGIGRQLHEPPSVAHVGPANHGPVIKPGMTFTIEPMINVGTGDWEMLDDGWTVVTADGQLSAQFEHTLAITEDGPEILSIP